MDAELNPAQRLHTLGQSLWLDSINRVMLRTGTLARYVRDLAVTGLTSNPTTTPSKSGCKGSGPPTGGPKRISHLRAGVAAMCHGHSRRPLRLALLRRPQRDPSPAHVPRLCAA